ncbi:hypothetical protein BXT86_02615 [candidate division WOR-3 bacterium 4484_100]|uniref:PDZ domain-containing protein n=1 Tax=candidate division WOR-3 bacterium 4484_100 TaxID=1936077 RepID=A0A1V4QFN1_UNCW3|nr:MAG: hypothetical protein BXT86_02615 [candidate division WOR-3 bacterium 4484_100]
MIKRDLTFIAIGIIITFLGLQLYNKVHSEPVTHTATIKKLNDEVSNQRANAIVQAAQKVSPAVVSITVIQTTTVTTTPFLSPFSDKFFRDFFRDFFPEYYYKKKIKSLGTGVLISADGYILTNEHVITNAQELHITLPDAREFKGHIIATDRVHDLALIKIDARNLPYAELGNSDDLMIGEWVIALGNPFGFLLEDTRPTVTVGVVSALNRSIKSTNSERIYKNMIQTDAAINPGNSGGPLVNILGQVIGINTFILTSGGGSEGIGFARPINIARKFINEAKKYHRLRTPWIGAWTQDITPTIARAMGIPPRGVLVSNVDPNSPAQRSGIKEGDRIIRVNDNNISNVADWRKAIANIFVDDTMEVVLLRNGDTLKIKMVVSEYKEGVGIPTDLGIYIEDINARTAQKYDITYPDGVVVTRVEKNSIGEKLGILPGDVILIVGNRRIRNKEEFKEALRDMKSISFIIDRGGFIIHLYSGY